MGRITFFIIGAILTSTVALATISGGGGGGGLTQAIADTLYARLAATNIFSRDQKINDDEVLAGGTYSGMRLQTTERASYCIGPSDGSTAEHCLSGGATVFLHGVFGDIYDGTTTGNKVFEAQPGLNRHWWAPTGSTVMVGGTGTPESAFMVGSHQDTAASFLVDTTNDWTKQLPITAPASTECDSSDEAGRLFFDSTSNAHRSCTGSEWTAGVQDHFVRFSSASATANVWSDDNIQLGWSGATGYDPELTISDFGAGGGFIAFNCMSENHTTSGSVNTAGPHDIFTIGLTSTGDMVKCTITADYGSYPQYNLTWFNADKAGPDGTATLHIEKVGQ